MQLFNSQLVQQQLNSQSRVVPLQQQQQFLNPQCQQNPCVPDQLSGFGVITVPGENFGAQAQGDQPNQQLAQYLKQEKCSMLVLDDISKQTFMIDFSRGSERSVDLIKVCENLPQANLSVKQAQKHWEQFRRRLREYNRRESEFISMTRLETQKEASFTNNCEKRVNFLKRMKLYDQRLHGQANQSIFVSQTANWQTKSVPKPVKILQKIEKRDNKLIVATTNFSRFILAPESNPQQAQLHDRILIHDLKADLGSIRYANASIQNENQRPQLERQTAFLNNLESELEIKALPVCRKINSVWAERELCCLIYGVFRFGEGQWQHVFEGAEFANTELASLFDKETAVARSSIEIAIKWQELKVKMVRDLKKASKAGKLTTKQDWLLSALFLLATSYVKKKQIKDDDFKHDVPMLDGTQVENCEEKDVIHIQSNVVAKALMKLQELVNVDPLKKSEFDQSVIQSEEKLKSQQQIRRMTKQQPEGAQSLMDQPNIMVENQTEETSGDLHNNRLKIEKKFSEKKPEVCSREPDQEMQVRQVEGTESKQNENRSLKGSRRDQKRNSDLKRKQSAVVSQNVKFVELNSDPVQKQIKPKVFAKDQPSAKKENEGLSKSIEKSTQKLGQKGQKQKESGGNSSMEGFEAIQQADQSEGEAYSVTISDRDMTLQNQSQGTSNTFSTTHQFLAYNQGLGQNTHNYFKQRSGTSGQTNQFIIDPQIIPNGPSRVFNNLNAPLFGSVPNKNGLEQAGLQINGAQTANPVQRGFPIGYREHNGQMNRGNPLLQRFHSTGRLQNGFDQAQMHQSFGLPQQRFQNGTQNLARFPNPNFQQNPASFDQQMGAWQRRFPQRFQHPAIRVINNNCRSGNLETQQQRAGDQAGINPYQVSQNNFGYSSSQAFNVPTPQQQQKPSLTRVDSQPSPKPMLTARQQLYQKHLEKAKQQQQASSETK